MERERYVLLYPSYSGFESDKRSGRNVLEDAFADEGARDRSEMGATFFEVSEIVPIVPRIILGLLIYVPIVSLSAG